LTTEMFENLCTLPLSSELFTQALHPKEPILAVGLSCGHVQSFRLPPVAGNDDDEDPDASVLSTGTSTIDTEWRTRRHKGSCRTLAYSFDVEGTLSQPPRHLALLTQLNSSLLRRHRWTCKSSILFDRPGYIQNSHPIGPLFKLCRRSNPPPRPVSTNTTSRDRFCGTAYLRLAYTLSPEYETQPNTPSS